MPKKKPMITQQKILDRGWSKHMIDVLLPEPVYKPNPHYKLASPMKLWHLALVEEIEGTEEFLTMKNRYETRKKSATKAITTKEANLKKQIDGMIKEISVKRIEFSKLKKNTLHNKQSWYNCFWNDHPKDAYQADHLTVERWMVNYIRHNLTDYNLGLYEMSGKVGCHKEYYRYRNAVLDKIAEIYPELQEECYDQRTYPEESYELISDQESL